MISHTFEHIPWESAGSGDIYIHSFNILHVGGYLYIMLYIIDRRCTLQFKAYASISKLSLTLYWKILKKLTFIFNRCFIQQWSA